jgi:hypothetical protein
VTDEPNLWGGPDADLQARIDRAMMVDPAAMGDEPYMERVARIDRLVAAGTYTALEPADREWLDTAMVAVSAGRSNLLQDADVVGGDWTAEDDAADAGYPPPPPVDGGDAEGELTTDELVELAELEADAEGDEVKGLAPDDDGWVG